MSTDFIYGDTGHGSVAQTLLKHGFSGDHLRPFQGPDGRNYITVNSATKKDPKTGLPLRENIVTNAATTLLYDEWKYFDQTVLQVARQRLRIWPLLSKAGTFEVPDALGTPVIQHSIMGDTTPATVSMDGVREGDRDRPHFDTKTIPLPITHKDFSFTAREIAASRRSGSKLDTTNLTVATRKVAEEIEKVALGVNSGVTYGGGTVYGLTNFPQRLTRTLSDPADPSWTPKVLLNEILAMRQQSMNALYFGPWAIVNSPAWDAYLDDDFSEAKGDMTVRERILKINGIDSLTTCDYLTGTQMIMFQLSPECVQAINGMQIKVVQWNSPDGMQVNFKVMAIMVPRLRADFNGNTGIVHGSFP